MSWWCNCYYISCFIVVSIGDGCGVVVGSKAGCGFCGLAIILEVSVRCCVFCDCNSCFIIVVSCGDRVCYFNRVGWSREGIYVNVCCSCIFCNISNCDGVGICW